MTTITRTQHNERVASGAPAPGLYAYICSAVGFSLPHLTHFYDLRDAHDQQIGFGRASGPTMARIKAERAGATFFVDEF